MYDRLASRTQLPEKTPLLMQSICLVPVSLRYVLGIWPLGYAGLCFIFFKATNFANIELENRQSTGSHSLQVR